MALTKISRSLLNTGISDSSDATAITIDSSERVGIGTTSPSHTLTVNSGSSAVSAKIITTEASGYLQLQNSGGDAGILSNGDDLAIFTTSSGTERLRIGDNGFIKLPSKVAFSGTGDAGMGHHTNNYMYIYGGSAGLIHQDNSSGSNRILIRDSNSIEFEVNGSQRMIINSSGYVGIGTSSPGYLFHVNDSASGGTSFQFQGNGPNLYTAMTNTSATSYIGVNGTQWEFYCGGTLKFQINTTNGGQTVSDQKFKKDIEDISYGLDTVKALQPRKFKWKENDESTIGFIAQEIKPVISEIITEPLESPEGLENGMTLNYSALTAVLTKAIQEQQTIIDDLKTRIEVLEA